MTRTGHAVMLGLVASFAAFMPGCFVYDAFEGRISNHTSTSHWYDIAVNSSRASGPEFYWNKTLPVGDNGTSYLGRVSTRNGFYTIRVTVDNETTLLSERHFHKNEGPGWFQVSTWPDETRIEYGFN